MSDWVGTYETRNEFHRQLSKIILTYEYHLLAVTLDLDRYYLYNSKGKDISKKAIGEFVKAGFTLKGFRLGGDDSVFEVKNKPVTELVYNKTKDDG
ncbi:MAG: hypothetical protein ACREAK_06835 [Nitrosarchaeum sp.]